MNAEIANVSFHVIRIRTILSRHCWVCMGEPWTSIVSGLAYGVIDGERDG